MGTSFNQQAHDRFMAARDAPPTRRESWYCRGGCPDPAERSTPAPTTRRIGTTSVRCRRRPVWLSTSQRSDQHLASGPAPRLLRKGTPTRPDDPSPAHHCAASRPQSASRKAIHHVHNGHCCGIARCGSAATNDHWGWDFGPYRSTKHRRKIQTIGDIATARSDDMAVPLGTRHSHLRLMAQILWLRRRGKDRLLWQSVIPAAMTTTKHSP